MPFHAVISELAKASLLIAANLMFQLTSIIQKLECGLVLLSFTAACVASSAGEGYLFG